MRPHLLVVLCLVCGCAESTATDPPSLDTASYRSGRRLRAHVWRGGGSEVFIDWSDQAFDTTCSYARLEDGAIRCAPSLPGHFFFSDGDCTLPLAYVEGPFDAPPYARMSSRECAGELPTVSVLALGPARSANVLEARVPGGRSAA